MKRAIAKAHKRIEARKPMTIKNENAICRGCDFYLGEGIDCDCDECRIWQRKNKIEKGGE